MKHEADLRKFDLNLLLVLDALFKEGSATRAALRLGISQPSVSTALARLRDVLGDPLFVKHATGLAPTPRAASLESPVAAMLQILHNDILARTGFTPETSDRTFVFVTGEIGQLLYLKPIFAAMRALAPQVRVRVVSANANDGEAVLDASEADVAIGYYPTMRRPTHYQQRLYESRLVGVAAAGHPAALQPGLTLSAWADLEHVVLGGNDLYFATYAREARKFGFEPRVALELPNFLGAPAILAASRLVAVLPESLGGVLTQMADVAMFALPVPLPEVSVKQYWHRRNKEDPANRWVRELIVRLLQRPR